MTAISIPRTFTPPLPAPARLPAQRMLPEPLDREPLLRLASLAQANSWDVSGSCDSIEQLGMGVEAMDLELEQLRTELADLRKTSSEMIAEGLAERLRLQGLLVAMSHDDALLRQDNAVTRHALAMIAGRLTDDDEKKVVMP